MAARYVDYRLGEGAKRPFKHHYGDAGWDLYASRPVTVGPGETVDVHTDIYISMPPRLYARITTPPRLYARITGRSSSLRKHRLLVNEEIIDNGYRGELFVCVHNMGEEPVEVRPGMRLAQVLFHVIEDVRWSEVDVLPGSPGGRGEGGFGSTGE